MSQITITDKFLTIELEWEVIQINRSFIACLELGGIVGPNGFGLFIKHDPYVHILKYDRYCELHISIADKSFSRSICKSYVIIPFHSIASAKLDPSKQNETFAALKAKLFGIQDPTLNLLELV